MEDPEHFFHLQYVMLQRTEKADLKMSVKMGDASGDFLGVRPLPACLWSLDPGIRFLNTRPPALALIFEQIAPTFAIRELRKLTATCLFIKVIVMFSQFEK
ncbi:MAG: hypothetical protein HS110_12840 [Zoogloeaceae bacterium]|nr:hypothetical protein [Zoogloeaceae bacterium]MCK6383111.1 hypothetical protein [Rhodocyclaceae bacterium]